MVGVLVVSLMLWGGDGQLPPPGEGLSLLPDPPSPAASRPVRPLPPPVPAAPASLGILAAGAWAARGLRTGRREPLVVFITGYGSESEGSAFAPMIGMLGLAPGQVRTFDYRWVAPADAHPWAARQADVDDLADGLQGYLGGLAETERSIYLVGHSLGGTTLAELLARWDRHPSLRVPEVAGAALLDPPIAGGPLGVLQSSPRLLGLRPHDGGYDPIAFQWSRGWVDRREDLGGPSGVPVVVFRNPRAMVTSFWGRPEGLRIFDVPDAGPHPLLSLVPDGTPFFRRLWELGLRIGAAHTDMLDDRQVAGCIAQEIQQGGSCRMPDR
ncbi:MAG: hypothetical protein ACRD02_05380 [Acidimicrobiia bacterium]